MTSELGMVVNFFTNRTHPDTRRVLVETTALSLRFLRLNPEVGRVILVDGSRERDDWMEEACKKVNVEYYHHGRELSYVEAYNLGWRKLDEPYIGLMANDIIPHPPTAVSDLLEWVRKPDVGSAHPYFATNRFGGDETQRVGFTRRGEITCEPSNFTLNLNLFKRSVLEEIGGLDENYLFGFGEALLLLKIRPLGYRVVMVGGVRVFHYDRLTKTLNESNLDHALYQADVKRWYDEHPDHASKNPMPSPIQYWKKPFTTTWTSHLVWWLAFHLPFPALRRRAIDAAMWIEPVLTRYPAGKSKRGGERVMDESLAPVRSVVGYLTLGDHLIVDGITNSLIAVSGNFYEDGWLAETGTLEFMVPGATWVELKGELPVWSGLKSLVLKCDSGSGEPIVLEVKPGEFQLRLPLSTHCSRHRIHFDCDGVFILPAPDDRKAALLVTGLSLLDVNPD